MRFIKVKLPVYYEHLVFDVVGRHSHLGTMEINFFKDLLFIIAQGYDKMWQYMISVKELYKLAASAYLNNRTNNIRAFEGELFSLRMDLIDFADSGFARALHADPFLTLEEKFMLVVKIIDEMMAQVPQNVSDEMKQSHAMQGGGTCAGLPGGGAQMSGSGKEGNGDGSGDAHQSQQGRGSGQPMSKADKAMTSQFFKGFNFMANHVFETQGGMETSPKECYGFSRGGSAPLQMHQEIFQNKLKISELVDKLWNQQYMQLFEIAHNIELMFEQSKTGKMVDTDKIASNLNIARMCRMRDVNRAVAMDIAQDEVLDRKIMNKQVRVKKFRERQDKKQFLYALVDRSGSMDHHYYNLNIDRLMFVKAITIALGKKAIKDGGKFYFRWFESGVMDVYKLERRDQWGNFLKHVLNVYSAGGTDVDLAMHTAAGDMENEIDLADKADMIVLTDGTQDVEDIQEFLALKKKGLRFHFLCLEEVYSNRKGPTNIEKLAETFQVADLDKVPSLAAYKPEFRKVI